MTAIEFLLHGSIRLPTDHCGPRKPMPLKAWHSMGRQKSGPTHREEIRVSGYMGGGFRGKLVNYFNTYSGAVGVARKARRRLMATYAVADGYGEVDTRGGGEFSPR